MSDKYGDRDSPYYSPLASSLPLEFFNNWQFQPFTVYSGAKGCTKIGLPQTGSMMFGARLDRRVPREPAPGHKPKDSPQSKSGELDSVRLGTCLPGEENDFT